MPRWGENCLMLLALPPVAFFGEVLYKKSLLFPPPSSGTVLGNFLLLLHLV